MEISVEKNQYYVKVKNISVYNVNSQVLTLKTCGGWWWGRGDRYLNFNHRFIAGDVICLLLGRVKISEGELPRKCVGTCVVDQGCKKQMEEKTATRRGKTVLDRVKGQETPALIMRGYFSGPNGTKHPGEGWQGNTNFLYCHSQAL